MGRAKGGDDAGAERVLMAAQGSAKLVYAAAEVVDAFVRALLAAHEVPRDDAAIVAACLIGADLRGVDTHGAARLPGYLDRVRRADQSAPNACSQARHAGGGCA